MNTIVLVFLDVLIIIGVSRLMGLGFRFLKQPLVIGEIVAGIMLGPSLLGLISPQASAWLFPANAIPFLNVLAQAGLIFFMFLIGLELNPKYLKGQGDVAVMVSHFSIIMPFSLGTLLALFLYPLVSTSGVSFTAFSLFMGAAMSITAFPVLARIITEKNLQSTTLGNLALTCAAVDDVTAWCLLAVAIAVASTNSMTAAIPTILLSALYIGAMLTLGRTFLQRLDAFYDRTKKLSQSLLAIIYMGVLGSALITEVIGIHLIFGAFLFGVIMPKNEGLMHELSLKTEEFVLIFLLPIFFAYSGLRTQVGLLNSPELWLICGLILLVAIVGKYIGTYVAARACEIPEREASALGWLMNTRGLTELIVLNIGLNLGVISPLLFTMLVIMALVTTFMTSPILDFIYRNGSPESMSVDTLVPELAVPPHYQVFVSLANPNREKGLVEIAAAIALNQPSNQTGAIYLSSLVQVDPDNLFQNMPTEAEGKLRSRREHLSDLILTMEPPQIQQFFYPIVQICQNLTVEVTKAASKMDLILVGWDKPMFSASRLSGKIGEILRLATVDVAVFIDSNRRNLNNLLVPYGGDIHDDLALELGLRILSNHPFSRLEILVTEPDLEIAVRNLLALIPSDRLTISTSQNQDRMDEVVEACGNFDLTIAGITFEQQERQTLALNCQSSVLIVRKYGTNSNIQEFLDELSQTAIKTFGTTLLKN
jgi:Kef-type K+ transport system membrane component KefB